MKIEVHDTAFMIAYYRAQNEEASRDPYAHLWIRDGVETWATQFEKRVSHHEGILHCMRNRYFYDTLNASLGVGEPALCLNLGAGFSMYPYTLPEKVVNLEIDFPEIMQFKNHRTAQFEDENRLPKRRVRRIAANMVAAEGQQAIRKEISEVPKRRKIILIEGVLFFLKKQEIAMVLDFCRSLMQPGDLLLCNSYTDGVRDTEVFQRLTAYFETELNVTGQANTTLPISFFQQLDHFELCHTCGTLQLGKQLGYIKASVPEHQVLSEQCYTLRYTGP